MVQTRTEEQRAVVVFTGRQEAQAAVEQLRSAGGFGPDTISVLSGESQKELAPSEAELLDPLDHQPGRYAILGAAIGGSVLGALGFAAGLGALYIPTGLAAEPGLATAIATLFAGALVGIATGGLIGGVGDLDTPEDLDKNLYLTLLRNGGALVVVRADTERLEQIPQLLGLEPEAIRTYPNAGTQGQKPNPTS